MKTSLILTALASVLVLAGCADEGGLPPQAGSGFGNAVRTNIAVQTVNPQAPEDGATISASGERTAIATERYAEDKVKAPENPSTSETSSGGGSSGAGMGGGSSAK